ncbi:gluconokinase [Deinococcus lacus]|uniref:Gluconokinase n=1 Tax=Deinococcus lacus TaxID=392561 RepID=A0ABW1YCT9_9DEIO
MQKPRHIVVMGVSGSGKTTLAEHLAQRLGWAFAEADDFHPPSNIAKMASGRPLNDEDRWPWLMAIRNWIEQQDQQGKSSVVPCSALKRSYRDLLRGDGSLDVQFVHLQGSRTVLAERMQHRSGHFMPVSLLDSQLFTLEVPGPDEAVLPLDLQRTPEQLTEEVVRFIGEH